MFTKSAKALLKAAGPDFKRIQLLLKAGADWNEIDPETEERGLDAMDALIRKRGGKFAGDVA